MNSQVWLQMFMTSLNAYTLYFSGFSFNLFLYLAILTAAELGDFLGGSSCGSFLKNETS